MRGRYEEYITLMGKYMKRYCAENGFFDYEWSQLNIFNVIDFINADDPKGDYKELLSGLLKIVKKLSPGSALEKQLETNLGYASRNVYREEDLLEILKVDSAWALASLQLARFYCNKDKGEGVWGKAIACYEEASGSKVVPIDYNDYFCLGYCYNAAQQTQQAIVAYEKCLAIEPNHPAANSNIGSCYEQLGEYRKALKSYEKSIEADQSDAFPYRCKFCLLSKMGENKTALAFAEANPKYFKTKHFQQAIDEMKRGKRRG
jgi:tetratricopeptide (TPR) repeat protein